MVIRELKDGRSVVSLQEDHAELSGQFAAHWGNDRFARLEPYSSMVFAATYHDSGYRDFEGSPPMNVDKGRPFSHREEVPNFETVELNAYEKNVEWVSLRDLYAGLIVSMHRTGLWQNRYNVFTEPTMRARERSQAVRDAKTHLEAKQEQVRNRLAANVPGFDNQLAYNYMALQIFDLLSLYFCCDGYAGDHQLKDYAIAPVRVSYNDADTVKLRIRPSGDAAVVVEPYPFDISPLEVSARVRLIVAPGEKSLAACIEAYHKAPRRLLTFYLTA